MNKIFEYAFGAIYSILNNSTDGKYKHFLGGSRRFGYFTNLSDYDIFVKEDHPGLKTVLNYGFKPVNISDYKFSNHHRMIIGLNHIDLIVVETCFWDKLRIEHDKIEALICCNKNFTTFIRHLKMHQNISGSKIYKSLASIV